MWHGAWISWLLLKQPICTGSFSVFSISTQVLWRNTYEKTTLDAHLPVEAITSALRLMGRHVGPGDDHGVRGADLVVLGESPVHVLGRAAQNVGAGVLAEEDSAHSVTRVQVSLQGRNHAELWRHLAKICGLVGGLCCGNKTVGVDLELKTEVEVTGRCKKWDYSVPLQVFIIIIRITTVEEDGPVPADPLWFVFTFKLIRLMIRVSVYTLLKQEQNKQINTVFTHFSVHTHTHTDSLTSWPRENKSTIPGPDYAVSWRAAPECLQIAHVHHSDFLPKLKIKLEKWAGIWSRRCRRGGDWWAWWCSAGIPELCGIWIRREMIKPQGN